MLLPELVGRLIRATVPQGEISKCDFAAEAETHRPGYDGTSVTKTKTLYTPEGVCYWELGCDQRPEQKAQSDYDKRIEEHENRVKAGETDDISQATFIAVTACDWHDKKPAKKKKPAKGKKGQKVAPKKTPAPATMSGWAAARTKEKRFKEVIAYDSSRLEQWIREAPAVGLWLAKEMGKAIAGVVDVGTHWLDIQKVLKSALPPEVLLVTRPSITAAFKDWLARPAGELAVRAPSALEVAATFVAWVHTLPDAEANAISSRAIIVEDRETWRELATSTHPLVLVASSRLEADQELFANTIRKGHFVLRHADTRSMNRGQVVELERMRRFDLQQALEKAGLDNAEARRVAHGAGGNFTILRRIYSNSPVVQSPAWSKDNHLSILLLAGAWEDTRPADQEIVQRLSGLAYDKAREVAAKWRLETDPPLRLITKERGDGKTWEFLSPLDSWEALHWNLAPSHLAEFEKIAVEVLSEDNPALSLSPDERPMAAIKGKVWKYSHALRQGIAEIMAIGATRQDESDTASDLNFTARAAAIVRQILPAGCSWQRWASLGSLLSSLVEAAPNEFLTAAEEDLASDDPQLIELLKQEVAPAHFGGAAYHSGLLWALETASWSQEHLRRATLILGRLTEGDPGGKWSNRPLSSAARVFFSWRPQTVAPVGERIEVLRLLCRETPDAAWEIIVQLIPEPHGMFMDSSKPSYRDWSAGWTGQVTWDEYFATVNAATEMAITIAASNNERWEELIDQINHVRLASKDAYSSFQKAFADFVSSNPPVALRERLWAKLRATLQKHSSYQKAEWAMPADELKAWGELRDRLRPDDLVVNLAHLFNNDWWGDPDEKLSYDQKQEKRAAQRRSAIRELWTEGGIDTVIRLAQRAGQPWAVGWALAEELQDEPKPALIPSRLAAGDPKLDPVGQGYAAQRINAHGPDWAEAQPISEWTTEQVGTWALYLAFGARTWDWVEKQGDSVRQFYWSRIGSWGGADLDMNGATRAVRNYQAVGRTWDALQFLVSRDDIKQAAHAGAICDALDVIRKTPPSRQVGTMDAHYVQEAFSFLQSKEAQADEGRVAGLEFSFLPMLDHHLLLPKTLHRQLARDPQMFVDCLKIVFRPRPPEGSKEDEEPRKEPSEEEREHAHNIWRLLHDWQTIPGTNEEGVVVDGELKAWVAVARKLASDEQRLVVGDIHIGEIFAKSPADSDGAIPLVSIRDTIEMCKSDEIERGFSTGLHNLRGVVSRALYEGGQQERELAATFDKYAKVCANWPRTAKVLKSVAKDYLRQAQQEDERAQARE